MPRVFRRALARTDLIDIWLYVAGANANAADGLLDKSEHTLGTLARNPLLGRERPDLVVGLRSFAVSGYVLFYKPIPSGIELIRVLHGARDIQTHMLS